MAILVKGGGKMLTAHFGLRELKCRCGKSTCDAPPMDMAFMQRVEELRLKWDRPLAVSSGTRCKAHNAAVGGAPHSQHLLGKAIDFHFVAKNDAKAFAALADALQFGGVGSGVWLVHVDGRDGHARWTYADK